jgi:ATP-dependent Clp protease ATP-binding subunit ClpB
MANLRLLDTTRAGRPGEDLERKLHRTIVGQDEAIHNIVRAYQCYLAGLAPSGRPIATLLFLGPTGTGKTRVVEATAEALLGNPRAVLKIDCAEFQHSHEIAKLIGSPPGYLGHRETHPLLSQDLVNQHHTDKVKISFILFDEIEKASDALWNLLLGILDKATLTLGDNRRVDFSNAMIFMTSNLGASEMGSLALPRLGFHTGSGGETMERLDQRISRVGTEAARRKFTPEFINRLDKIVVFKSLGVEALRNILDLELDAVTRRIQMAAPKPFFLELTESARVFLLAEGTDARYGARHLKRSIERLLVQPLSNLIASGQVRSRDCVRVTHNPSALELDFFREVHGWDDGWGDEEPSRSLAAA